MEEDDHDVPNRRRVVVIGLAAGAVATAAVVGAAEGGGALHGHGRLDAASATRAAGLRPGDTGTARLRRSDPVVAPLRRLTPPDVVVWVRHAATPRRVSRLRRLHGVAAVSVVDGGTARLPSGRIEVIGVDPSTVRGFTPRFTAVSNALWRSVAGGELTVSYSRARRMRRDLGRVEPIVHGAHVVPSRIGAFASIGLGRAEGIVDRVTAARLGLARSRGVLVSAPRLTITTLRMDVRAVFGRGAVVHVLRPAVVDQSVVSGYARATIPPAFLQLYRDAAATCAGLPWTVLAAIGAVETRHGADTRTSSKGAVGPMQFLPSTFAAYAVDGDGDGIANIRDPSDAVFSAARYLCMWGAGRGGQSLYDAIWAYNHADWYVRRVLALAVAYS